MVRGRSQSPIQARGQTIMKHTNTQLCVDSLPLFLPIHHNRPLIPPRSAHQGQTAPVQRTRTHLVEPKSGIILAYGRSRIEQGAHEAGVPGALTRAPAAPTTPLCPTERNHKKKQKTRKDITTYETSKKIFNLSEDVQDMFVIT